jgi:hypothetical protein
MSDLGFSLEDVRNDKDFDRNLTFGMREEIDLVNFSGVPKCIRRSQTWLTRLLKEKFLNADSVEIANLHFFTRSCPRFLPVSPVSPAPLPYGQPYPVPNNTLFCHRTRKSPQTHCFARTLGYTQPNPQEAFSSPAAPAGKP